MNNINATDRFISNTTAGRSALIRRDKTALRDAVAKLRENEPNGSGSATPAQILAAAEEFELWGGPSELEGVYLDAVDRDADA
jgi:hypothetical protein